MSGGHDAQKRRGPACCDALLELLGQIVRHIFRSAAGARCDGLSQAAYDLQCLKPQPLSPRRAQNRPLMLCP